RGDRCPQAQHPGGCGQDARPARQRHHGSLRTAQRDYAALHQTARHVRRTRRPFMSPALAARFDDYWRRLRATRTIQTAGAAGAWIYEGLLPREPDRPTDPETAFASTRELIAKGRVIILVFFVGFLGWAALAPLDSAIMAPGVIV